MTPIDTLTRVESVDVTLTADEARAAAYAGTHRRLDAMRHQRVEVYGKAHQGAYWDIDVEAAAAELAAAKACNVFWSTGRDPAHDRAEGDLGNGLQVRHTKRRDGSLILHPRDHDHHTFILVVGQIPTFTVAGWIRGADGKSDAFWRTNVPRPAFFVPQSALLPLPRAAAAA